MVAGASRSRTADSKRLWILGVIWVFRVFSALRFFGRLAAPSWPPSAFSRGLLCAALPRFESGRPTCCPLYHHPDPAAGGDAPLKSSRPASPTAAPALCTPPLHPHPQSARTVCKCRRAHGGLAHHRVFQLARKHAVHTEREFSSAYNCTFLRPWTSAHPGASRPEAQSRGAPCPISLPCKGHGIAEADTGRAAKTWPWHRTVVRDAGRMQPGEGRPGILQAARPAAHRGGRSLQGRYPAPGACFASSGEARAARQRPAADGAGGAGASAGRQGHVRLRLAGLSMRAAAHRNSPLPPPRAGGRAGGAPQALAGRAAQGV